MLNRKGFTLIELLIVIIIVGILAAVSVPMMRGNVEKARKSEAVAALGAIRTAERLYFAEKNTYVDVASAGWAGGTLAPYIQGGDLNGQYYSQQCYTVAADETNDTFLITAAEGPSTAPGAADINGYGAVTMNQDGTITGY